jgi:SOS response regulatory protein OraA/RecX
VQELRSAGVAQELGVAAVEEQDDAEVAYTLAKSKMRFVDQGEWERVRAKLSGLLQRRGFSWAVTRAAIDRCWREMESSREGAA